VRDACLYSIMSCAVWVSASSELWFSLNPSAHI